MSKRFLSLILSFMLVLCLAACHSETTPENSEDANVVSEDDSFLGTGEMTSLGSSSAVLDESELEVKTNSQADSSLDTPKTEVKTNSQLNSSTEIVLSSPNSSETTSSGEFCDVPPPDAFYGDSLEEFVQWMKSNQKSPLKSPSISKPTNEGRKLIVPHSIKDGLRSGSIAVEQGSNVCVYNFQTDESNINSTSQLYTINIKPLTSEDIGKDLTKLYYPDKEVLTGNYKGIEYAYKDGYEGTGPADRFFASAWFIQDGYVIKIAAFWSNSFKPWSTDYFDYFDFETITL